MFFPETVITGCGNPLYADDGFGPAVIQNLKTCVLPAGVKAIDTGTGGNEFVFSLLDPMVTRRLIVVDAADFGAKPGSLTLINLSDLPAGGITDHQPGGVAETLLMMKDIKEILLLGCQPGMVTYPEMHIGLSPEVTSAIPLARLAILNILHDSQPWSLISDQGMMHDRSDSLLLPTHAVRWKQYQFFPCSTGYSSPGR
ncbi:MAG TPA: hydrogenase maturation protease [Methanospirillum sp.]|uniref:hydrogenase maturation protease n=1 Tax=Methanospirillum sp. TaxID=45200 RepID=UPI002BCBFAFB|nr:hydrogenase maturation protease [Methanospirillum sp.]HWQ63877.1 hydrogenase maturation protease [Methanospirillum sp.]